MRVCDWGRGWFSPLEDSGRLSAGSEQLKKSRATGERRKETVAINSSLLARSPYLAESRSRRTGAVQKPSSVAPAIPAGQRRDALCAHSGFGKVHSRTRRRQVARAVRATLCRFFGIALLMRRFGRMRYAACVPHVVCWLVQLP